MLRLCLIIAVCGTTFAQDCFSTPSRATYTGTYARTISGKTCQRWDKQKPHAHEYTIALFPDAHATLESVENYCRDPDNDGFLWCYTTDSSKRWERCGLSRCECYTSNTAQGYDGTWAVTKYGHQCQRWDSQYPHNHGYTNKFQFQDSTVAAAANHCRDPGNDGYLWCYTTNSDKRWGRCDIERC